MYWRGFGMVEKIRLKNFKCFEAISLDCKELNLFTGVNGMGKSTLIQALLLLRQTYERNRFDRDSHIILNGHYVNLGKIKDISYWYKNQGNISLIVEESTKVRWECYCDKKEEILLAKFNILDPGLGGIAGNGFEYISAERLGPRRYYDDLGEERFSPTQIDFD